MKIWKSQYAELLGFDNNDLMFTKFSVFMRAQHEIDKLNLDPGKNPYSEPEP